MKDNRPTRRSFSWVERIWPHQPKPQHVPYFPPASWTTSGPSSENTTTLYLIHHVDAQYVQYRSKPISPIVSSSYQYRTMVVEPAPGKVARGQPQQKGFLSMRKCLCSMTSRAQLLRSPKWCAENAACMSGPEHVCLGRPPFEYANLSALCLC